MAPLSSTPEAFSLKQACVFCGEKPESKTKEHILPQWLLKLTGDPNRQALFGIDHSHFEKTGEIKQRKFSYSSFKFPACEGCNNFYSALESRVEKLMGKVLSNKEVSSSELVDLLDWFDKVRIGLWLAFNRLDNWHHLVEPKFYIRQRSAGKDRALFIYEAKDTKQKRLTFTGVNSPVFTYMPSCFALVINDKVFFNESSDFLVSGRLGFPSGEVVGIDAENGNPAFAVTQGTESIHYPIKSTRYLKGGMELYQPIWSANYQLVNHEGANLDLKLNSPYIITNSLNATTGIGKVFYKDYDGVVALDTGDLVDIRPYIIEKSMPKLFHQVRNMVNASQLYLWNSLSILDELEDHEDLARYKKTHDWVVTNQLKFARLQH